MVMLSEEFRRRGEGGGTVRRAAAGRSRRANHHGPCGHGGQRYPGAAALTRLGGGTGFRGVEIDGVLCGSPLPLNVYSPYGNLVILNPSLTTAAAGTTPLVQNLYQGMLQDPVTGLYYERARWYSPSLGTWISQDPLQYVNGANTYQMEGVNPTSATDPSGLVAVSLSSGQMATLAGDVANTLHKDDGAAQIDGWDPRGAAAFVPYELGIHEASGLANKVGKFLLKMPYSIMKDVMEPEINIIKEGGKMAAEEAKKIYEEWLHKQVQKGAIETYTFSWSSHGRCGVSANMFLLYFPATHKFTGEIFGSVGEVRTSAGAPVVPATSPSPRSFSYPFSGTAALYQAGFFDFYQWHLTTGGIVSGTWRYNGNG